MSKFKLGLTFALALIIYSSSSVAAPHEVFGTYLTEEQDSHIQIADCGDGSPCGRVVWLDPTKLGGGLKPEDVKTKAGEPVLGLLMLQGFKRKSSDWRNGTIYAPGKDKTYSSRLERLDDGTLQVKGCISFLCQTQIWTPVLADSQPTSE